MKKAFFGIMTTICALSANSQKIDSIYFHLYTDSLKKGVHNYINVDAKMSDGKWRPLTAKDLIFTTSYGTFEGNDLVLPDQPTEEKVKIKATLRSDSAVWKEMTIWIKKKPDDEALPTTEEILKDMKKGKVKKKG